MKLDTSRKEATPERVPMALVFCCNAMRVKTFLIRYKQTQFVRDRITQLRLKKGVSEYQMSYDLGHSRSYVYNISSGKSLPPMAEFLQICNYFDITPSQFFDESEENPALLQTAIEELRKLNDDDLMLIIGNIRRLTRE